MPKVLYIPAIQKNLASKLTKTELNKLPKKLLLLYSIQYKELASSIKSQLLANKIKVERFQQVLGCSNIDNKNKLPVLFIGTGEFHLINLYLQSPIIYILKNHIILKIPANTINKIKAYRKTALIKFLKADNIGILVSTKPGQENLKQAETLKKQLENKGKQAYIFISDYIDISQFENFSIDSWVNTACSGLAYDNPSIINISEIPKL